MYMYVKNIITIAAAGSDTRSNYKFNPIMYICMWCVFGEYILCIISAHCTLPMTGGSLKRLCECVCVPACTHPCDGHLLRIYKYKCTDTKYSITMTTN